MSEIEYRILCYLRREAAPVLWCKILSDFSIFSTPTETDSVLKAMLFSGLLLTTSPTADPQLSSVVPSNSAILELIREDEQRKKLIAKEQRNQDKADANFIRESERRAAERIADKKFQIHLSISTAILSSFVSASVGALFSNLDRLIPWFISLFH